MALTSQSYGSPLNPLLHPIFLIAFIKFKDIGRLLFAIHKRACTDRSFGIKTSKTEVLQMPSAIKVNLGQGVK